MTSSAGVSDCTTLLNRIKERLQMMDLKQYGQGQRVDAVRLDAPGHSSRGQRVSKILTVTMINAALAEKYLL